MSIQRPSCFFNLWSSCSSRQSSAGGTAYSRLPWPAVLPRRPQRPLLVPPLARASLYSPTPPLILRRRQPHTAAEPVNARAPLRVGIHCHVLPDSASSPSNASPSSTAVVLSARHGQCGQRPTSIGRVLYVVRLTAGSTATAQFFVICQVSRFVRPVGLQIFQDEESFHSAGRENGPSVMRNGLYIFKTHQTGN